MQRCKPLSARNQTVAADKDHRRFKCSTCDKRFRRSEHCTRHELMHTEERPFVCRYCKKRYGRKDLLRRHERTIHADQWSDDAAQPIAQTLSLPDMADDSAAEGENQLPPSLSSSGADQLSENPQAPNGSRDESGHQTSLAAIPPTDNNVSTLTRLPLDVASVLDPSLTVTAEPCSFLNVGDLGISSFSYPDATGRLMLSGMLPPGGSASAAPVRDAVDNIERHDPPVGPFQSHNAAQPSMARSTHPSIPPLPSSERISDGSIANMDFTEATHRWHPPSGDHDADYNLHSLNLDFDLGQTPLETWFQNSDNVTLHLPIISREPPGQSPRNLLDDEGFEAIVNDVSARLGLPNPHKPPFTFREMQQFINTYIDSFHPHQPFIHLPSLSFTKTPCPLILAMGSIGALYRLKRRRGYELYALASEIISSGHHHHTESGTRGPLWLLQTRLLLAIFGSFSNKQDVAADTFHKLGHMMLEYQWRRIDVQHKTAESDKTSWDEWITVEETKRTLCAMFIFSNLLLITFNITPGYVIDRDLCIDIPDHESLWAAISAAEWDRLRQSLPDKPRQTVQSAVEYMVQPPPEDDLQVREPNHMSGFTALVVIHAVNIYLWHLNQLSQSVSRVSLGIWPQENLRTALLHAASMTLERCQATLLAGKVDDDKLGLYDPNDPYIFNCGAMLRVAYSRLLPSSHSFNRLVLLTDDEKVVTQAVKIYACQPLERSKFVTRAAKLACNGFLGPVTIGALLVSKTAALSWSIEQAIAGWDSALLLTKWVHRLELAGESNPPDPEEQQIVNDLRTLVAEMDVTSQENEQTRSLAALLARAWAFFLDDTWVWGVTPNMGFILRLLADEYQEQFTRAGTNMVE